MFLREKDESLTAYWISFWPTAPLFGVRWRFAPVALTAWPVAPFATPPAPPAAAEPAAEAAARAVEPDPEPAVEPETTASAPSDAEAWAAGEGAPAEADPSFDAALAQAEGARPATLLDARPDRIDDLKRIRGVGPKLETLLNDLGVYTFDQIAGFDEANLAWIDERLATFKGRPFRDDWPGQARALLGG